MQPLDERITDEIISAQSSLRMMPEGAYSAPGYLCEVDDNAKHSLEHMQSAMRVLNEIRGEIGGIKKEIWHALGDAPEIYRDLINRLDHIEARL